MCGTDRCLGALIVISHLSDDQPMKTLTPQPSIHPSLVLCQEGELVYVESIFLSSFVCGYPSPLTLVTI